MADSELERLETELYRLTDYRPGHDIAYREVIPDRGFEHNELRTKIRRWLILRGAPEAKATIASDLVLNNAYRAGQRYIDKMAMEGIEKRMGRTPVRGGHRVKIELDDPFVEGEVLDELVGNHDGPVPDPAPNKPQPFDPREVLQPPTPTPTPPVPTERVIRFDPRALAKAVDEAAKPMLLDALKQLVSQVKGVTTDEVSKQIEAVGLGKNLSNEIVRLAQTAASDIIQKMVPRRIELKLPDGNIRQLPSEPRHKAFDIIIKFLSAGSHVYMVGPKGSGKTHLFKQVATALDYNLETEFFPIDQSLTKYDVKGYKSPTGDYITTLVYRAVKFGGLMCIDEGDMWAAPALGSLNSILANDFGAFGDEVVNVHPKFRCILAANTYGHGANRGYEGRNPLDRASLDRFSIIEIDYDPEMELQIFGTHPWVEYVHRVRAACLALKYDDLMPSMRAIEIGLKALQVGITVDQLCAARLWRGEATDRINKIQQQAGPPPDINQPTPEPDQHIELGNGHDKVYNQPNLDKINEFRGLVVRGQIVPAMVAYRTIRREQGHGAEGLDVETVKLKVEQYRDGLISIQELFA